LIEYAWKGARLWRCERCLGLHLPLEQVEALATAKRAQIDGGSADAALAHVAVSEIGAFVLDLLLGAV
jgi:hypothetical protein